MSAEPKFHRWVDPAGRKSSGAQQTIEANDAERIELARWLDVPAIHRLHADLEVVRTGSESAEVRGSFAAEAELVCGVSLESFVQPVTGSFVREFRKAHGRQVPEPAESAEVEIDLDADEPGEWRQQGIDLGLMLAEELSLALPDFPRKPGAELEETPETASEPERENPFEALSRLKDKNG